MYICKDCGCHFDYPVRLKEPHGEWLAHCPSCMGIGLADAEEAICESCGRETVEFYGDKWCLECRRNTNRLMQELIVLLADKYEVTITTALECVNDLLEGAKIEGGNRMYLAIADELARCLVDIAYECETSLYTAQEMAEAWSAGTMN